MGSINSLVDRLASGKTVTFLRSVGLPRQIAKRWIANDESPSLPQVVRVAEALDATPEMLFEPEHEANLAEQVRELITSRPGRPLILPVAPRAARATTSPKLRAITNERLDELMKSGQIITPQHAAQQLGLTKWALRYRYPMQYQQLASAAESSRAKALKEKEHALRECIASICAACVNQGRYPSKHLVAAEMKRLGHITHWNRRIAEFLKEWQLQHTREY